MEFKLSTLDQLEKYTRKGDSLRVANVINSLRLSKIPREYSAQLSQICFRNGLYLESLKILNKIIYGETSLLSPPEPNELISYATSLVSLNMPKEARKVLKGVNKLENPEALLIESFSHFGDWNYKKTLPILKKFISNPRISHYRSLVGKLNLAAAYIDVSQFN
ncbi:MAG: hypothetical protein KDD50_16535, partial [Bdellovibrionales bacterium]|nr:hypothetical protein [Bdellovibrionales bacterium]